MRIRSTLFWKIQILLKFIHGETGEHRLLVFREINIGLVNPCSLFL
jgi:hypothetical protein